MVTATIGSHAGARATEKICTRDDFVINIEGLAIAYIKAL
jgi:hypothetical protein